MEDFLKGGEDIVFIVNDGTRPTPTAKVLDALSKRMDLRSARYLIATGTHRDMTPEEYDFVFGSHYQTTPRTPSASTWARPRTAHPWRSTRSQWTRTG